MAAEFTDQGGLAETLDQVVDGLDTSFFDEFGTTVDTSPQAYTGREIPIISRSIVQLQNLSLDTAAALNLDSAQGRQLDAAGVLLSTPRLGATRSTITVRLFGAPGVDVTDKRVRYKRNDTIWRTPTATTLIGANGTLDTILTAAETGRVESFQDGTDQWVIVDEVVGWTAVESLADANFGEPAEDDPTYRDRLRLSGRSSGVGTEPGEQRAILRVAGVTSVQVLNNRGLGIDVNGVAGKSVETVVEGGTDESVGQAILDSFGGTDGFVGSTEVSVFDALGNARLVKFTRVARIDVVLRVTIDTTGATVALPDDAVDTTVSVTAARVNSLGDGVDVQPDDIDGQIRAAFEGGTIPENQIAIEIGLKGGAPPVAAVFAIAVRQRARTFAGVQAAQIIGTIAQTFVFDVSWILSLAIDGGNVQAVEFFTTDFVSTGAATTLEIATAINSRTTGLTAGSQQGLLTISSDSLGASSSVSILAATTPGLLAALGLTVELVFGSDGDITVIIT